MSALAGYGLIAKGRRQNILLWEKAIKPRHLIWFFVLVSPRLVRCGLKSGSSFSS